MKTLKLSLVALLAGLAFFFQCTEDEIISYYNVSGTVTYPDGNAGGAYVYLAEGNTPTTMYSRVAVTDASGNYTFDNLVAGDYFLWANYNTSSQAAGRLDGITFLSGEDNIISITNADVAQNIALLNHTGSSLAVDETWTLDATHSQVAFEFPYKDASLAVFEGRFNSFDFALVLDDNNLAGSSLIATVDLKSSHTGKDGRDGPYNCISGNLGIEWTDTNTNGVKDDGDVVVEGTDFATFTSTSISLYGDGYKAEGKLNLNGSELPVTVLFKYFPGYTSGDPAVNYSSFEAYFQFDAKTDFGIGGSIGGLVDVYASAQYKH